MKDLRRCALLVPVALWAAGMVMLFHPILFSRFEMTLAGLGDVRLVNFMLEHSYRWLIGNHVHADFWSPPVFFPHRNVAAYSELVIGAAAPYWLLRAFDLQPVTSYLLWVLITWSLNFVASWLLLRRIFGLGVVGASLGAFLVAFGNPRSANIAHQHLAPFYYVIAAVAAVVVVFGDGQAGRLRRRVWIGVFGVAVALQAYTAFYPLFFLGLSLLVAGIWAIALPDARRRLLEVARRDGWAIAGVGVVTLAALVPVMSHYLRAAAEVGMRAIEPEFLPRPASWVLMGRWHPLYGWLQEPGGPFAELRESVHTHGVGPVTTVLAITGLVQARRWRSVRLMVFTVITLILATTMFPGGFSGWRLLHAYVPGAAALRAVGRIGAVTVLPLALGVAVFFDRLTERRSKLLLVALAVVMVAEQNHELRFRDRASLLAYEESLVAQLEPGCETFLLVYTGNRPYPHVHDDAAWVTLRAGIPTINGRYGNYPPDYGLYDVHAPNPEAAAGVRRGLDDWIRRNGLSAPRVCWIETSGLTGGRGQ
jgi:hypothetical protein